VEKRDVALTYTIGKSSLVKEKGGESEPDRVE
jgi:hypothetical protein